MILFSVSKQLVEIVFGLGGPVGFGLFASIFPFCQFEPFAEVGEVLFVNQFGPPIPALLGGLRVVADAVFADAQIAAAFFTGLAAAGLTAIGVFGSAFPAVAIHGRRMKGRGES